MCSVGFSRADRLPRVWVVAPGRVRGTILLFRLVQTKMGLRLGSVAMEASGEEIRNWEESPKLPVEMVEMEEMAETRFLVAAGELEFGQGKMSMADTAEQKVETAQVADSWVSCDDDDDDDDWLAEQQEHTSLVTRPPISRPRAATAKECVDRIEAHTLHAVANAVVSFHSANDKRPLLHTPLGS